MVKRAPSRFNPDLLAREDVRFEATLPISQFPRLSELVLETDGNLVASFDVHERKSHRVVRGSLTFDAVMQCQRCMEPFSSAVQANFELVCVNTLEEANALPDALDPVVLDEDGQLHLVDLLEEDALLQLPDIPKHEDDDSCQPDVNSFGEIQNQEETQKPNPFGALKDLKLS